MSIVFGTPAEPRWLDRTLVESMHDDVLASHGGLGGIRDAGLLESALAKPMHLHDNDAESDLADWAAAYAVGIARNLPFPDGNKRTAFVSLAVFLRLNGQSLDVPEPEAVLVAIDIATGAMPAAEVAAWIRRNTTLILRPGSVVRDARRAARRSKVSRKKRSA